MTKSHLIFSVSNTCLRFFSFSDCVFTIAILSVLLVSCAHYSRDAAERGFTINQIWPDGRVLRDAEFGSIWAFNIVPGSNTIIEVSHRSGPRPANSTKHASFDTLLIALPSKWCLNTGSHYELTSTDNRVLYSEFTGWQAVSLNTNATAKAVVTVLSAAEKTVCLHIECLLPCIWDNLLHPTDGEAVTFEKRISTTALFNVVDKKALCLSQSPIVTFREHDIED